MENTASSQTQSTWPGAFGAYRPSKEAVLISLSTFVWLYIFTFVSSAILGAILRKVAFVNQLVGILIGCFFGIALVLTVLSSLRGKRMEVGSALSAAPSYLLNYFLLEILVILTCIASVICFVIPAFFIIPRISLAGYFLLDKNMSPIAAYKASWEATRGHVGKVYGIIGVTILMVLPTVTIIGVLATVYLLFMYAAATGLLYLYITGTTPAQPAAATSVPAPDPAKTNS